MQVAHHPGPEMGVQCSTSRSDTLPQAKRAPLLVQWTLLVPRVQGLNPGGVNKH